MLLIKLKGFCFTNFRLGLGIQWGNSFVNVLSFGCDDEECFSLIRWRGGRLRQEFPIGLEP